MMNTYLHWVLKSVQGFYPFNERQSCVVLWKGLREIFPEVYAAVIMPNHAHWVTHHYSLQKISDLKFRLELLLNRVEKLSQSRFSQVSDPVRIPDQKHLIRTIRYIHLNPCRSKLSQDPLCWEWSTHLDYLGVIHSPWANLEQLSQELRRAVSKEWLHSYISHDPTTSVSGTPYLISSIQKRSVSIDDLSEAFLLWMRESESALQWRGPVRKQFVLFAKAFGFSNTQIADHLGLTPHAIIMTLLRSKKGSELNRAGKIKKHRHASDASSLRGLSVIRLIQYDPRLLQVARRINVVTKSVTKAPNKVRIDKFVT